MSGKTRPVKLVFLVLPNANMLDFAGAAQVFHEATEQGLKAVLHFCSFEKNIHTSYQLPFGKLAHFSKHEVQAGDYIFIVSAHIDYIISKKLNPGQELMDWLTDAHEKGVTVCSLCNGAFLLGKTGLLNGRNCTTHFKRTAQLQQRYPLAKVQENILFVEDRGIITSAGATSGIDVALYILNKLSNDHFTYKVSRELVIYTRRSGSQAQESIFFNHRNHMHSGIHRVQDWLAQNLEHKLNMAELAEIAQMSERNFTRIFKKETGSTVNEYLTLLRKEKIEELMKNPDLSRDQIARQCGLKSVRHLSRLINGDKSEAFA